MSPAPGARLVRHAGDCLTFTLRGVPPGWTAKLRTNIGRAATLRDEIVRAHFEKVPLAGASWRDLPLRDAGNGEHVVSLPLAEVGFFKAKAYALDERGNQHWPSGADTGVSVHPSWTRSGNTLYCAFPRQFGPGKARRATVDPVLDARLAPLDQDGYTVIPPSGTLRDLVRELPHITGTLGCRILHLLPVSPVPTTFGRFGRFGSPYALQDLTAIDPALVEFDHRTTGIQQFCELARATHAAGARLMLDLVINHTGWGSALHEQHPEWFVRTADGRFESPGAWGAVWEDLVELDQRHVALWEQFAEAFLIWCRRGVDAFRCDAGYKVPLPVWQYITARVRQEFPDTVFLLEGLGGSWEATDDLLGEGGMQWAYSELFQNFGGQGVQWYLDHALATSQRAGTLVHYSETHDNSRLAARNAVAAPAPDGYGAVALVPNRTWSLHRNLLSALTSVDGGFGFTNGVEWLATEQVNVHSSRGLAWGSADNLVAELGAVNRLLADHPCFFAGATIARVSPDGAAVFALRRDSAESLDSVLVLVNTDVERSQSLELEAKLWRELGEPSADLAGPAGGRPEVELVAQSSRIRITLRAAAVHCLAASAHPRGLSGEAYRRVSAQADWAVAASASGGCPIGAVADRKGLAAEVAADPAGFLARASGAADGGYRPVVAWHLADRSRITPVPPGHWLLVHDDGPFRARLTGAGEFPENAVAIPVADGFVAAFPPRSLAAASDASLALERHVAGTEDAVATLRFLAADPLPTHGTAVVGPRSLVLLTNGRGGMSRLHADLGRITSKYDCLLGANLGASIPMDRHVFAKRIRGWVDADGFITALNGDNLVDLEPGPPAHWRFIANAGDGRSVEIHLVADLLDQQNTVVLRFTRPDRTGAGRHIGRPLPADARVRLTVRVDIEDRNFHWETQRNEGSERHFSGHCREISTRGAAEGQPSSDGFAFTPAPDRGLRVWADAGEYHRDPEWSVGIPHPVEATRGQEGGGDAYSPGWFELPIAQGESVTLVATAEPTGPTPEAVKDFVAARQCRNEAATERAAAVGQASSLFFSGLPARDRLPMGGTASSADPRAGSPGKDRLEACPTPPVVFTPFDPNRSVAVSGRHLPHWNQPGATYFVTFRLSDSLPRQVLERLESELVELQHKLTDLPADERTTRLTEERSRRIGLALDEHHGECWLRRPDLGALVEAALRHFDGDRYALGPFVVMPNHVHVLVVPIREHTLSDILHTWKSFTANQANRNLGRTGPFWQEESFDHLVRDEAALERFTRYIETNPAQAGLDPAQFRAGVGSAVGRASSLSAPGLPARGDAEGAIASAPRLLRAGSPGKDRLEACPTLDAFTRALVQAVQAYVVRRDDVKTVIAGYPWFLDWGRDSLICARGLLAAGMTEEVRQLLIAFGRFEKDGTLPNSIHGADASNRDTTDAPLWFGVVCEEMAEVISSSVISRSVGQSPPSSEVPLTGSLDTDLLITGSVTGFYSTPVDATGRTLGGVVRSFACGYLRGTPNGIRVDAQSGLVWSPSHFTWMDTNHPAGTPREGYPIEIQALWIRLLRQLARIGAEPWEGRGESWADLARRAEKSFENYYWLEECGWYADNLRCPAGQPARTAPPDNALRSNCLLAVSLGLATGERARRTVEAARRWLVIPGALRSLAPLPVVPPLAIYGNHGGLLNDPDHPYWPRYEGDEDTRRKPAYHNGTAWTWTFPVFCEALVKAFDGDPRAIAAARAYLGSTDRLMAEGCLGHLPEIVDGDAPHTHRGCDAQAWGATEVLRVWRWLGDQTGHPG